MKFIPIILGLYFLYYVGMVIYDLFLKKEKVVEAENSEQNYSISDFAQQNKETPVVVGIEDVENIRTPKSYEEIQEPFLSATDENQDIEKLKNKYEDENKLEEEEMEIAENKIEPEVQTENKNPSIADKPISNLKIKDILNHINTKVKMVANYDGQKVYHISFLVNPKPNNFLTFLIFFNYDWKIPKIEGAKISELQRCEERESFNLSITTTFYKSCFCTSGRWWCRCFYHSW